MATNAARKPSNNATQFSCDALQLGLPIPPRRLSIDAVAACKTIGEACAEGASVAGHCDKAVAAQCLNGDGSKWSRIKSGQAAPDGDFLLALMDFCGNEAPLVWLLLRRNYDPTSMRVLQTEQERKIAELERKLAEAEAEMRAGEAMFRRVLVGQAHP